jgi:putative two-component system response regulator
MSAGTAAATRAVGEAIPMSGRIVAVVDFFDALTMDRCYRKAFSDEVALDMLVEQRGAAFDPRIVDTFVRHVADLTALRDRINANPPSFEQLADLA